MRQEMVAENGVSASVRTLEISGGGPVGAAGVVVVLVSLGDDVVPADALED